MSLYDEAAEHEGSGRYGEEGFGGEIIHGSFVKS